MQPELHNNYTVEKGDKNERMQDLDRAILELQGTGMTSFSDCWMSHVDLFPVWNIGTLFGNALKGCVEKELHRQHYELSLLKFRSKYFKQDEASSMEK